MKELQNIIAWVSSLSGAEVECEALVEWLELEERAAMRRGGVIVARMLTGLVGFLGAAFLGGSALTLLVGGNPARWGAWEWIVLLIAAPIGSALLVRVCFGPKASSPLRTERNPDAMRTIAHLRAVHGSRGLRKELGEHGLMELNEGAQLFLRCRSTLTAEPWVSESANDPWVTAGNDLLRAMESALERLTLYVVKKRPFVDIAPVLDEMRTASNEIQRITAQRWVVSGGAGRDLRASLARMKELAAAEDELLRVRE
ncbi:MAG: hypothetical protein ACYC96_14730 [Fimbriimonadaceae bacterium]